MIKHCFCTGFAHYHTSTTFEPTEEIMRFKDFEPKIDVYTGCITLVKLLTPKILQKEK